MDVNLSLYEMTVIPAIIAVLQVIKMYKVPAPVIPTISLILGVVICGALGGFKLESLLNGLIVGGLAVGVHSGTKNSIELLLSGKKEV